MAWVNERTWSDWISHDDTGWPAGLEPDEIVIPDVDGDILSPMPASSVCWHCPGDPVVRYRRAVHSISSTDPRHATVDLVS